MRTQTADHVMRRIGEHITGFAPTWATREACVEGLGTVLAGKRALIVLDNAASIGALEPLDSVLDTDTRVVGTTRIAGLAADLGARSVSWATCASMRRCAYSRTGRA
jgi:hypothetical protein